MKTAAPAIPRRLTALILITLGVAALFLMLAEPASAITTEPAEIESVAPRPPTDGLAYRAGEQIHIDVTYDKNVHIVSDVLEVDFRIGSGDGNFRQARIMTNVVEHQFWKTTKLTFVYTVLETDTDWNGITIDDSDGTTGLPGSTIGTWIGDNASETYKHEVLASKTYTGGYHHYAKVEGQPAALDVAVSSTPAGNDTYGQDDKIEFTFTFSEPVDVTGNVRECRQKSLLQIITARSWQAAKYDAALLA